MVFPGPGNCLSGDSPIKSDEGSLMMDGEGQKVNVRELVRTQDVICSNIFCIGDGHITRPELMVPMTAGTAEKLEGLIRGYSMGITGLGQDSDETVLGDGTCRPSRCGIVPEPLGDMIALGMVTIEEGHQDVHVEQSRHQIPNSSRSRLTSSFVTIPPR